MRNAALAKIFLAAVVTVLTLAACLLLLRRFAPTLLGLPPDLAVVQSSTEVPPFFDNVFRPSDFDYASPLHVMDESFLIPDPVLLRARPLFDDIGGWGPHDVLGFRNESVPNCADLVTIGDSQTYGNNATIRSNWPGSLERSLGDQRFVLYNAAVGGWGGIEYWEIFQKLVKLEPRVVVVAFYTGNDPIESFRRAYSSERWESFRTRPDLDLDDLPKLQPSSWVVELKEFPVVFRPGVRLASNRDRPAVQAGFDIMIEAARRIADLAFERGVQPFFTIIPTKELVYRERLVRDGVELDATYEELVRSESANQESLGRALAGLRGATFVDVTKPLQEAAMGAGPLYPPAATGHPTSDGYRVIGETIAAAVKDRLRRRKIPDGPLIVDLGARNSMFAVKREEEVVYFYRQEVALANGWGGGPAPTAVTMRELCGLESVNVVHHADPSRFGPENLFSPTEERP